MRKLIILVIVVVGGYQFNEHYINGSDVGAFDELGNPQTFVFTFNECGKPCDNALVLLDKRKIEYENVNLSDGEEQFKRLEKQGGGQNMPILIIGSHRVVRYHRSRITSVLAEVYGRDVLRRAEANAMQDHFDSNGKPVLVMYGTKTCGYCKKAVRYFSDQDVDFKNMDIEENSRAKQAYQTLEGSGTPLIYVGFRRIEGFRKDDIDRALALL
jgi:glutaredoxin